MNLLPLQYNHILFLVVSTSNKIKQLSVAFDFGEFPEGILSYFSQYIKQVESGRYDDSDDFVVVLQPGLVDLELPKKESALLPAPDLAYLAPNCIYPSQKLQALSE